MHYRTAIHCLDLLCKTSKPSLTLRLQLYATETIEVFLWSNTMKTEHATFKVQSQYWNNSFLLAPNLCWPGLSTAIALVPHTMWSFPRLQRSLPLTSPRTPFAATTTSPSWLVCLEVLGALNFGKELIHFLPRLPVYFFLKRRKGSTRHLNGPHFRGEHTARQRDSLLFLTYIRTQN